MADLTFSQGADPVALFNDASGNQAAVNSDGSQVVSTVDSFKTTYSAASSSLASAATATDIFTIFGSATKTIRILKVGLSAIQTTAGDALVLLIKRSATNTGGTSASVTSVPHDSNNAIATATVLGYTANPTSLGAAVGTIRVSRVFIPPANANTTSETVIYQYGDTLGQAIVLRGTSQGLCINLNSTTLVGGTFSIWIEWSEE